MDGQGVRIFRRFRTVNSLQGFGRDESLKVLLGSQEP